MTPEKYLQELLGSQDLTSQREKDLQGYKKGITDYLRSEFDTEPVIRYAGSWAKGTMIRDRYDLDIVCYFPSSDTRTIKEIRSDVAALLSRKYLTSAKASAERILDLKGATAPRDFHIDVVPGRFIAGTKDVFLHVAYGDKERMQTNLKTHIDHIANSGCVPVIRLVKLWSHRNNVPIKTFILELFVVEALSGSHSKNDLKKSFLKVLKSFKDDFSTIQLVDPANSNNVVSRLLNDSEKKVVALAAGKTYGTLNTSDSLNDWKRAFDDNTTSSASIGAAAALASVGYAVGESHTPTRQYGGNDDYGSGYKMA